MDQHRRTRYRLEAQVGAGWAPYRYGKWQWFDGLGYTWIADDTWGWLPYHYGRWTTLEGSGWVWVPGDSTVFKPGEVYWLKSARLVGWGALAPGETWRPPDPPQLYLNANTTYATYVPEAHDIDPAGFTARPKEVLPTAVFVQALSSPPFPATRLDAFRPELRVSSSRAVSVVGDAAFDAQRAPAQSAPPDAAYAAAPPASAPVDVVNTQPDQSPYDNDQLSYGLPAYLGIIVVQPPPSKAAAKAEKTPSAPPSTKRPDPAEPHTPVKPKPVDPNRPVN